MIWHWWRRKASRRLAVWVVLASLVGVGVAFGITQTVGIAYYYVFERDEPLVYLANAKTAVQNAVAAVTDALSIVPNDDFVIPKEGRAIVADLKLMRVTLYENGLPQETVPIAAKGRSGTPWETPAGHYDVLLKKEKHFSSIGEVWMPYNLQFFGNFFIHGWPTYGDGTPVPRGYSGGCIRLETEDAKLVYDFAEIGTPIIVKGATAVETPGKKYLVKKTQPIPWVTAQAYVVADVDSGEVLAQKNWREVYPVASVTKLMTALVSLDVINQYQTTTISRRAVSTYGTAGNLKAGEKITISNLIYPLLLESSNDAAEALAEHHGRERFISLMNERARAAGLAHTAYEDPSGLSPENVSTAEDLFKLARYIYNTKPFIFDIVAKARHTAANYTWINENDLVGSTYFLGGKNGFTDEAGQTMVSLWSLPLAKEENRRIAIILLQSHDRKADTDRLLKYVSNTMSFVPAPATSRAAQPAAAFLSSVPLKNKVPDEVTMSFVGDIMFDRGVLSSLNKNGRGDYHWLFEKVDRLAQSDILFGNLEGPLSDVGKNLGNLYSFRMKKDGAPALRAAGFDVLSIANNHIGDWGQAAFLDTVEELAEQGIMPVGGDRGHAEAIKAKVFEAEGLKVGFIAATDVGPAWLAATETESGIILASDPLLPAAIKQASSELDIVVVSFHFGNEYETMPSDRQRQLAKMAIDQGAKIVVGHHPHVVQPVERYKDGLIAYSLGNFIFDQYFSEETMRGLALTVTIRDKAISEYHEYPVVISPQFQPAINQ